VVGILVVCFNEAGEAAMSFCTKLLEDLSDTRLSQHFTHCEPSPHFINMLKCCIPLQMKLLETSSSRLNKCL